MFKLSTQNIIRCTKSQLEELTPDMGQIIIVEDTDELLMWTGTEWSSVKSETNSEVQLSAYDLNKQIIGQMPDLTDEQIEEKKALILDFCAETRNTFYMLLCRDINYFTLCHRTTAPADAYNVMRYPEDDELIFINDLVIECVQNVGAIKSIEQVDGAIEIWITNPYNETHAMYFFPYDGGVEACQ